MSLETLRSEYNELLENNQSLIRVGKKKFILIFLKFWFFKSGNWETKLSVTRLWAAKELFPGKVWGFEGRIRKFTKRNGNYDRRVSETERGKSGVFDNYRKFKRFQPRPWTAQIKTSKEKGKSKSNLRNKISLQNQN